MSSLDRGGRRSARLPATGIRTRSTSYSLGQQSGGLIVLGDSCISEPSVLIENPGSGVASRGGNYCGITLGGNGTFRPSAAITGTDAGVVIDLSRESTCPPIAQRRRHYGIAGIVSAAALLTSGSNAQRQAPRVVAVLNLSRNSQFRKNLAGSDTTSALSGVTDTRQVSDRFGLDT